jgi:hypothetical protein
MLSSAGLRLHHRNLIFIYSMLEFPGKQPLIFNMYPARWCDCPDPIARKAAFRGLNSFLQHAYCEAACCM